MNSRTVLNVACAALGAAGLVIVTVAACTPDQPVSEAPVAAQPVIEDDQPAGQVAAPIDPADIAAALDTPCVEEDSVNCYWRADLRGNGLGTSFVNVEGHIFPLTSVLAGGAS